MYELRGLVQTTVIYGIISSRFMWRGLSSDVTAWACGCLACQRGKIHCHTRMVPQPIPIPQ
jgi:hypothetical protein